MSLQDYSESTGLGVEPVQREKGTDFVILTVEDCSQNDPDQG